MKGIIIKNKLFFKKSNIQMIYWKTAVFTLAESAFWCTVAVFFPKGTKHFYFRLKASLRRLSAAAQELYIKMFERRGALHIVASLHRECHHNTPKGPHLHLWCSTSWSGGQFRRWASSCHSRLINTGLSNVAGYFRFTSWTLRSGILHFYTLRESGHWSLSAGMALAYLLLDRVVRDLLDYWSFCRFLIC